MELQNSWQSLSAEWQPLCGGTAPLAALCLRDNSNPKCTVSALVEPNGLMALLNNHSALANIPLASKIAFIHPQLHRTTVEYIRAVAFTCTAHEEFCFLLPSFEARWALILSSPRREPAGLERALENSFCKKDTV